MRNITCLACAVVCGAVGLAGAQADVYTFHPNPVDMWDLEHQQYVTWGIALPGFDSNESIVGASLFIDNINDWTPEPDILYVHLLDDAPIGTFQSWDGQGGGDAFAGQGILLTTYSDPQGYPGPAEDLTYDFTAPQVATLEGYAANGVIGIGADPDCHYWNDGVTLTLMTTRTQVPAPGAALLGIIGLGLVGRLRRLAA